MASPDANQIEPLDEIDPAPHEIVLSVSLDERAMPLGEVLDLRVGSTLTLSRRVDDALELCLDGVTAGHGYAVERDGALGVLVTESRSATALVDEEEPRDTASDPRDAVVDGRLDDDDAESGTR